MMHGCMAWACAIMMHVASTVRTVSACLHTGIILQPSTAVLVHRAVIGTQQVTHVPPASQRPGPGTDPVQQPSALAARATAAGNVAVGVVRLERSSSGRITRSCAALACRRRWVRQTFVLMAKKATISRCWLPMLAAVGLCLVTAAAASDRSDCFMRTEKAAELFKAQRWDDSIFELREALALKALVGLSCSESI
eukprot:SAG31_NODE_1891_length_6975_cov_11.419430_5_plen_195_part_00